MDTEVIEYEIRKIGKVWKKKYKMNIGGDNWQIVFTNDKISWSKVAFSIQLVVIFSFEIWHKMTNRN